jgi:hypothetical protein
MPKLAELASSPAATIWVARVSTQGTTRLANGSGAALAFRPIGLGPPL